MGSRSRSLVGLLLGLAATKTALAAEPEKGERVTASGACFDAPAVAALLAELGPLEPALELRVEQLAGRVDIVVTAAGEPVGTRSIDAVDASCTELTEATSLAVGLALAEIAIARAAMATPVDPEPRREPPVRIDASAPEEVVARPLAVAPPRDVAVPAAGPASRLQAGVSAELGLGVAFTAYTSLVATVAADVAYAPDESWSPEVSGRAGMLASFPSRITIDEVDVWPGGYAARLDGCGGTRAAAARLRACATAMVGAIAGDGIQTDTIVALGGRVEGTWRASSRVGLFVAVDALSLVRPLWVRSEPGDFSAVGTDEVSDLSLLFSSGSNFDWL